MDGFVASYVQACTSGKLPVSECGPVWQLGIIATLLTLAVLTLIALRVGRSLGPSTNGGA